MRQYRDDPAVAGGEITGAGRYYENLAIGTAVELTSDGTATLVGSDASLPAITIRATGARVSGFRLSARSCGPIIGIYVAHDSEVSHNVILDDWSGCSSAGIELSNSHRNQLLDNEISVSGTAIYLNQSATDIRVEDNRLHNSATALGTFNRFSYPMSVTFKGNQVTNNSRGLWLSGFAPIEIEVSDNDFTDNDFGISSGSSTTGRVYHNNFIGNAVHVSHFLPGIDWHNGYLDGGNFWSGWTEPDDFGGSEQTVPGADGIVDLPYHEDEYPFTVPSGWLLNNTAPVAVSDCCITVYPMEDAVLDASQSYDLEGPIARFAWQFEDGSVISEDADAADDGLFDGITTVSYDTGGQKHFVTLEVTDSGGLTDQATIVITVLSFEEGLAMLTGLVESYVLDQGPENAILAKIRAAQAALNDGDDVLAAIENLQDLINQLSARGFCKRQVPEGFCDAMLPEIERLQNSMLAGLG